VIVRSVLPGYVIGAGLLVAAAGFAILAQIDVASGLTVFVVGSVVASIGIAPTIALGTDMIVGAAPPEQAGAASAISETGTELGLAVGVAIIGSVGAATYRSEVTDAIPAGIPNETAEAARDTIGGAVSAAEDLPGQVGADLLDAARESFIQALQTSALLSAAVAACVAVSAAFLLRRVRPSPEPEAATPSEPELVAPGVQRAPCVGALTVRSASEFDE
jgi:MFS transporter, DHA2 family, multidrug resistance protein